MSFQINLRKYREGLGMTAKDFAAMIGLNYTTYANYENRGKEPKYETLCKIAAALHVSIDELLGYKFDKVEYWKKRLKSMGITMQVKESRITVIGQNGDILAYFEKNSFIAEMENIENQVNDFLQPSYELITKTMVSQFIDKKSFEYQKIKFLINELQEKVNDTEHYSELERVQFLAQIKELTKQP